MSGNDGEEKPSEGGAPPREPAQDIDDAVVEIDEVIERSPSRRYSR